MSDRPTKKRALMPTNDSYSVSTNVVNSPPSSSLLGTGTFFDSSMYKAELEHERSLRVLDARRAQHEKQRLENLVKFSQMELEQTKTMLEEERVQSDHHLAQMRNSRDELVKKLRDLQQQVGQNQTEDKSQHNLSLWQQKCNLLTKNLEAKDQELDQLRGQIRELRTEISGNLQAKKILEPSTPTANAISSVEGKSSPAPENLMRELARIRIELAEEQRKNRQNARIIDDLKKQSKQLVQEKEAARSLQIRNHQLESQMQKIQKSYEKSRSQNEEWKNFEKALAKHFPSESRAPGSPPEITLLLRSVGESKDQISDLQKTNKLLEDRVTKLKDMNQPVEARMKSFDEKEASWKQQRGILEDQLKATNLDLETARQQERIWKREIESLKEMIDMLDNLPLSKPGGSGPASDAKLKTVELELQSTKDELKVVKADRVRVIDERSKAVADRDEKAKELDRVKEKYGRLREALELQKGRAEEAESRAQRAEELAGKGAFNPDETRILHLSQNPLSQTLQQQNAALKKKIEALQTKSGDTATASTTVEVDPEKLHKRLRQSFKEQISLFREGVYLITGYRIEMIPNMERHAFRVRSMYAEREEDQLVLMWPDLPEGESASSLDMMSTEQALELRKTDSYQYITRYKSMPAFFADVQLRLFEKQTVMTG